jgi:hypothetical protein
MIGRGRAWSSLAVTIGAGAEAGRTTDQGIVSVKKHRRSSMTVVAHREVGWCRVVAIGIVVAGVGTLSAFCECLSVMLLLSL